ncbi:MAG: translation elongation factor Ts [Actinomycetota bacterium]|nr:translation elongation factor Ts [Actinomycetota bacterium]
MANFTAKDVQALRQSTGAGMMDAKKALTEADGDAEQATEILRQKGLAKSLTRSDRENAEGLIAITTGDGNAALVQLRAETDFSAKSDEFVALVASLAEHVLAKGADAIAERQAEIDDLKLTTKENIALGDVVRYESQADTTIDAYLHGGGRVGVLVEGRGIDDELLHEIALHIAFAKPRFLTRDEVPADEVEKERAALLEITKAEGRVPEAKMPGVVEGRLGAWYGQQVLLDQGMFGEKETVRKKIGDGEILRFTVSVIGG